MTDRSWMEDDEDDAKLDELFAQFVADAARKAGIELPPSEYLSPKIFPIETKPGPKYFTYTMNEWFK